MAFMITTRPKLRKLKFHIYAEDFSNSTKGMDMLGWVKKVVTHNGREKHEKEFSEVLGIEYFISELSDSGEVVPATDRDVYYPIALLYPRQSYEHLYGLDQGTNPTRVKVFLEARDTNQLIISEPHPVRQGEADHYEFILSVPVYSKDLPQDTIEARRKFFVGFVFGYFEFY